MARENFGTLMVTFLKVIGLMTRRMDLAFTHMSMVHLTLVNGRMIYNTAKAKKTGLMAVVITAPIKLAKNMAEECTGGQMVQFMKEIG